MHPAIARFIADADQLIRQLEAAVASRDPAYFGNAEIALENVRTWRILVLSGLLPGAYSPNFGISKADLQFGPAETAMYRLERLYVQEILPLESHAPSTSPERKRGR
jgi:hypothetical protein